LTYESERWPGEVHIFVATLDDPEALRPQVHVNVAEKLAWISLDDGLPQKAGFADGDD
nr:GFA family protein [Anaerolineae bacterium]